MSNDNLTRYSKAQRLAKARFWAGVKSAVGVMPERLTDAEMVRYAKTRSLLTWIKNEEFRSWFLEQDYGKALATSSGEEAVHALLEILAAPLDPKAGVTGAAKVAAAGRLLDAAGLGKPKDEKAEEESLEGMSEQEIRTRILKLAGGMDHEKPN